MRMINRRLSTGGIFGFYAVLLHNDFRTGGQLDFRGDKQLWDEFALDFSIQKVENTVKNDCNASSIPDGLVSAKRAIAGSIPKNVRGFWFLCYFEHINNLVLSLRCCRFQSGNSSM